MAIPELKYIAFEMMESEKIFINRLNVQLDVKSLIIKFESLKWSKTMLMIKTVRDYHPPTIKFTCPTITYREIKRKSISSASIDGVFVIVCCFKCTVPLNKRLYLLPFAHTKMDESHSIFTFRNSHFKQQTVFRFFVPVSQVDGGFSILLFNIYWAWTSTVSACECTLKHIHTRSLDSE